MILLCSGQDRTKPPQDHDGEPVRMYPTVIAALDEDAPDYEEKLTALWPTVVNPFCVRLLDKDLAKLPNLVEIMNREMGHTP
jgi:galactose-1-phosphate uridylyltransferase